MNLNINISDDIKAWPPPFIFLVFIMVLAFWRMLLFRTVYGRFWMRQLQGICHTIPSHKQWKGQKWTRRNSTVMPLRVPSIINALWRAVQRNTIGCDQGPVLVQEPHFHLTLTTALRIVSVMELLLGLSKEESSQGTDWASSEKQESVTEAK